MSEERAPATLHTERLVLRPFETGDAPDVARMAGDPRLADTLFQLPRPYRLDDALEWIDGHVGELARGRRHAFAVCLRACGTLVGTIALRPAAPASIRAELGCWTGVEHWSRGYASEAARAVVAFGFDVLGLERIEANHLVRNPASGRVMRNAGMRHEGLFRAYGRDPHTGRIEDVEQWAVTRAGRVPAKDPAEDSARDSARVSADDPRPAPAPERTPGPRLATVSLLVHDYDAARDWFVGALGFRVVEDTALDGANKDGAPKRWLVVVPPGGGSRLLLARAGSDGERATVGRQGGGRVWLFLETGDFARDHARLVAAGVRFDETPRREPYGTVAVFRDVCGNPWDLIEPGRA